MSLNLFPINVTFPFFQSEGKMLKEAVYINRSLSFLEQAILALADRRRDHVPFRQSKLTHALKDSLGETDRPLFFLLMLLVSIWYAKSSCVEILVKHNAFL